MDLGAAAEGVAMASLAMFAVFSWPFWALALIFAVGGLGFRSTQSAFAALLIVSTIHGVWLWCGAWPHLAALFVLSADSLTTGRMNLFAMFYWVITILSGTSAIYTAIRPRVESAWLIRPSVSNRCRAGSAGSVLSVKISSMLINPYQPPGSEKSRLAPPERPIPFRFKRLFVVLTALIVVIVIGVAAAVAIHDWQVQSTAQQLLAP
jgi:hypothetical protein